MLQQTRQSTSQAGFTLVELAIVMIIIGLLIAGVLKGQELIGNARVTSTVAQIKGIDAATSTFKDTYAALPGDMLTPNTRIPNCLAAPCSNVGNGDGKLANIPGTAPTALQEGFAYFAQLAAADLLTGIAATGGSVAFGVNFPQAKIDSAGFFAGSAVTTADLTNGIGVLGSPVGVYLSLVSTVANVTPAATSEGLTPSQASRIDTKLDDGSPGSGGVVAVGTAGVALGDCGAAGAGGLYATVDSSLRCALYIHIQG
jgi:prepilin-type N-terminal cleavage/methylation domain-containing protein